MGPILSSGFYIPNLRMSQSTVRNPPGQAGYWVVGIAELFLGTFFFLEQAGKLRFFMARGGTGVTETKGIWSKTEITIARPHRRHGTEPLLPSKKPHGPHLPVC